MKKIGHDRFSRFHDYDIDKLDLCIRNLRKRKVSKGIWRGRGSKFLFVTKEILVISEPGFKV